MCDPAAAALAVKDPPRIAVTGLLDLRLTVDAALSQRELLKSSKSLTDSWLRFDIHAAWSDTSSSACAQPTSRLSAHAPARSARLAGLDAGSAHAHDRSCPTMPNLDQTPPPLRLRTSGCIRPGCAQRVERQPKPTRVVEVAAVEAELPVAVAHAGGCSKPRTTA